jgi:Tfp pilus assembly protein PilO
MKLVEVDKKYSQMEWSSQQQVTAYLESIYIVIQMSWSFYLSGKSDKYRRRSDCRNLKKSTKGRDRRELRRFRVKLIGRITIARKV